MKKNQGNELPSLQNNITLSILFKVLSRSKLFIIAFTLFITVAVTFYSSNKNIANPTFNSSALVQIGGYKIYTYNEYILLDSVEDLSYELNIKFIDSLQNDLGEKRVIKSINPIKDSFIEINSASIMKEEAVNKLLEVVDYIESKHNDIISEIQSSLAEEKNAKLTSIQLAKDYINNSRIPVIDQKIELIKNVLTEFEEDLSSLKSLANNVTSPQLERLERTSQISKIKGEILLQKIAILDLEKDKLKFKNELKHLEEARILNENESNTSKNIYSPSAIVGEIITEQVTTHSFNKYLLIIIGFMSSLTLACFAVLIINGLRSKE